MPQRILVQLYKHGKDSNPRTADFSECILEYFNLSQGLGSVYLTLRDNFLVISDFSLPESTLVFLKHPVFCPIQLLDPKLVTLPEETIRRGVDVGVAIILESADGKVLLTKRAGHLRIFPGLWVPPGGHIEENESLLEAGLRELKEETGLTLELSDCLQHRIHLLALWESAYPSKLSEGIPVRHHIVVYFTARLQHLTSEQMEERIQFDPGEVDACAWLDREIVSAIAHSDDEDAQHRRNIDQCPEYFRAITLDESQKQVGVDLPLKPLFAASSSDADYNNRVSTGTKFALEQFLEFQTGGRDVS